MQLEGFPSDDLPDVLATGRGDAGYVFVSLSARDPDGRDADYIAWHSLDHRPEQYRLAGLRNAMRLVSTPQCRAVRAASEGLFDGVDHVMTYQFTDPGPMPAFGALGAALEAGGRMGHRLPSLGYLMGDIAGRLAAPRAVAGADVIPWRPALGAYLIVEQGQASPEALLDVPGVAGIWWYHGARPAEAFGSDASGMQLTYCYLDRDPVEVGQALSGVVRARWALGAVRGLLAAPFHAIVPFDWGRHLP